MKMTKGMAFLLCLIAIMFVFISMLVLGIVKKNLGIIPVASCLTGIGSLAGLYIAGSVANNGIKGHNWCQEMYDTENRRTDGK